MKLTAFATDPVLEQEGVWVPVAEDLRFRIARIGNPKYQEYVRQISKPHRALLNSENPPPKLVERLTLEAMGRYILLDWEGLEDEAGNPLAYSPEEAVRVLTEYRELREIVSEVATSNEAYRRAEVEQAKGNSRKS